MAENQHFLLEINGSEPTTSSLPAKRSPNWAIAPIVSQVTLTHWIQNIIQRFTNNYTIKSRKKIHKNWVTIESGIFKESLGTFTTIYEKFLTPTTSIWNLGLSQSRLYIRMNPNVKESKNDSLKPLREKEQYRVLKIQLI